MAKPKDENPEGSGLNDDIRIEATREVIVHVPAGVTMWSASLLPDRGCGEGREKIQVRAVAENEAQARDLIRLTLNRLAYAFAASFTPNAGEDADA
jgi:hypothetical protein